MLYGVNIRFNVPSPQVGQALPCQASRSFMGAVRSATARHSGIEHLYEYCGIAHSLIVEIEPNMTGRNSPVCYQAEREEAPIPLFSLTLRSP
jgi:hypothetical protein